MTSNQRISLTAGSERRCPLAMPEVWEPPVPAFCSDLSAAPSAVVVCLGVQSRNSAAAPAIDELQALVARTADRIERAWYEDARHCRNDVLICYWADETAHRRWADDFAPWWADPDRLRGDVGYWRETFGAPAAHRETLFSADDRPAGLGALGAGMIGPVAEHGYWGGARDRIPASADDALKAEHTLRPRELQSFGRRIVLEPSEHLCVIRSAQDWSDCEGRERELYSGRVHPVLLKGMQYLRDCPVETGCCSCRFMHELDAQGRPTERSFALAHFVSLAHLERWAASHPTHLAIFDEFLAMAGALGPEMRLRLWHEVYVLPAAGGCFEYLNCHPQTGLLPFEEPVGTVERRSDSS